MAFSVTSLAWGLLEFKDAYYDAGELDHMYDSIKWPLDYLMKCHVSPNVYYVQVCENCPHSVFKLEGLYVCLFNFVAFYTDTLRSYGDFSRFQLKKTSGVSLCIISGTSGHLSGTTDIL